MKKNGLFVGLLSLIFTPLLQAADVPIDNLQITNTTDIQSLAPQDVVFLGSDRCTYHGNTRNIDNRGGVSVTLRECPERSSLIKARAYIIEIKHPGSPAPLLPAGNVWMLKEEVSHPPLHQ